MEIRERQQGFKASRRTASQAAGDSHSSGSKELPPGAQINDKKDTATNAAMPQTIILI
ncbi:hypothetical protein [Levilactobacillus cerevisiae]|uniref:hypothetical protein n=1 Tax=Levilactobacillus cerevisiae TaxID=1704076 RepID=UPI0013DDE6FB|nr:hypothetical protein [Levilactobacillus cerevisiae]